jgi:hypothetical protein
MMGPPFPLCNFGIVGWDLKYGGQKSSEIRALSAHKG